MPTFDLYAKEPEGSVWQAPATGAARFNWDAVFPGRRTASAVTGSWPSINLDAKFYSATRTMDEARHAEIYGRFLHEKVGLLYPINDNLQSLLGDTLRDSRWDMPYLGMQVLIEGLAPAAFGMIRDTTDKPLPKQILAYVMQDEARHVAFGRMALRDYYRQLTDAELREREEFVMACSEQSEFLALFRKLLFSRIVPCVKDIGLWGKRLHQAYVDMGVLELGDSDLGLLMSQDEEIAEKLDAERFAAAERERVAEVEVEGRSRPAGHSPADRPPPLERAAQPFRYLAQQRRRSLGRERRAQGEGVRGRAVGAQVEEAGFRLGHGRAVSGRDPPEGDHRLLDALEPFPAPREHLPVPALVHVRRERVGVPPHRHVDDQPGVAEDGHVRRVTGVVLQSPHEALGGVGVRVHGVQCVDEVLQLRGVQRGLEAGDVDLGEFEGGGSHDRTVGRERIVAIVLSHEPGSRSREFSTASITARAIGAASPPPLMSPRSASASSTTTATATGG